MLLDKGQLASYILTNIRKESTQIPFSKKECKEGRADWIFFTPPKKSCPMNRILTKGTPQEDNQERPKRRCGSYTYAYEIKSLPCIWLAYTDSFFSRQPSI